METCSPSEDQAEEADKAMANLRLVVRRDLTEEVDHVVISPAGDVDVSKEDNDVPVCLALDVGVAKEADGVVHRCVRGDVDVGKEVNGIAVGVGWSRSS